MAMHTMSNYYILKSVGYNFTRDAIKRNYQHVNTLMKVTPLCFVCFTNYYWPRAKWEDFCDNESTDKHT